MQGSTQNNNDVTKFYTELRIGDELVIETASGELVTLKRVIQNRKDKMLIVADRSTKLRKS